MIFIGSSNPNHLVVLQSLAGGGMGCCKLDFSELWFWKRLVLAGVDLGEESGSDCHCLMVVYLRFELFEKGKKNGLGKGGISTHILGRCVHGGEG